MLENTEIFYVIWEHAHTQQIGQRIIKVIPATVGDLQRLYETELLPRINQGERINTSIIMRNPDLSFLENPAGEPVTKQQLNNVYAERDKCVALIYHMARLLGYPYGLRHSLDMEPGWQNCAMIDLPTGQVSWHIQDSEEEWFAEGNQIKAYTREWDGHDTEEKYRRVLAFAEQTAGQHALHVAVSMYQEPAPEWHEQGSGSTAEES